MKLYKDILDNIFVLLLKVYFPTVEKGTWVELYVKKNNLKIIQTNYPLLRIWRKKRTQQNFQL